MPGVAFPGAGAAGLPGVAFPKAGAAPALAEVAPGAGIAGVAFPGVVPGAGAGAAPLFGGIAFP